MTAHGKIVLALLVCMSLFFTKCEKEEDFNVDNLNHNVIMVLGHAGMGDLYKYPNNSYESIEPVIGIGADGTELDLQMTKDSVLILFHDETLDGRTRCNGFGSPYEYSWSEIKSCYYNTVVGDIPIYTAEEVFSNLPDLKDLYFSLDIKLDHLFYYDESYRRKFLRAIHRLSEKHGISKNIFLEGDLSLLLLAKELGMKTKGIVIGSTVEEAANNNIFGIGMTIGADINEINAAHQNGLYVMMWGAKSDAGNKQAIRLNPDFLQTDKPIPMLMLFDRFNYDYKIP